MLLAFARRISSTPRVFDREPADVLQQDTVGPAPNKQCKCLLTHRQTPTYTYAPHAKPRQVLLAALTQDVDTADFLDPSVPWFFRRALRALFWAGLKKKDSSLEVPEAEKLNAAMGFKPFGTEVEVWSKREFVLEAVRIDWQLLRMACEAMRVRSVSGRSLVSAQDSDSGAPAGPGSRPGSHPGPQRALGRH